ncbi:MAG TPA: sulfate ABC transporter ATP-binding protein [Fimbriimonas sp.]|nr:sulfate ABC transporter ATP-binding protein [Fimbriimonas sp.]
MSIEVKNVSKRYGNFHAVNDVSLTVPTGKLVALLGPSGSGKTTLLRIIAGLEDPDQGSVAFAGKDATSVSVRHRKVGFVFQHYALFKHMSVFENIAFGLRVRPRKDRPSKAEIKDRVTELLRLVQLEGMAQRFPSQLSGGQRQRVALARALAVEPQVLLLDEPFGALDARVRQELRAWLRRLHDELHITSVFVTHDQEEAMEVADEVVVMNKGGIEQIGSPEEVYEHPASPFVFQFLGQANQMLGRYEHGKVMLGGLEMPAPLGSPEEGSAIALLRPHDLSVEVARTDSSSMLAMLKRIHRLGPMVRLQVELEPGEPLIDIELMRDEFKGLDLEEGAAVYVRPRRMKVYAK